MGTTNRQEFHETAVPIAFTDCQLHCFVSQTSRTKESLTPLVRQSNSLRLETLPCHKVLKLGYDLSACHTIHWKARTSRPDVTFRSLKDDSYEQH